MFGWSWAAVLVQCGKWKGHFDVTLCEIVMVCMRTKDDSRMDSKELRRQTLGLAVRAWSLVIAEDARRLFSRGLGGFAYSGRDTRPL